MAAKSESAAQADSLGFCQVWDTVADLFHHRCSPFVAVSRSPRPAMNWDPAVPSRSLPAYAIKHPWGPGVLGRR